MKNSVVSFLPEEWRKLSHRERRKQVNKARRKCKRTAIAIEREKNQKMLESRPEYQEHLQNEERQREERDRQSEAMRLLQNAMWLEREKMAQEEFSKKKELEEKRRKEKEEREQLIREEWETLQKKEKEGMEARDRERKEKEEKRKEALQLGETTRNISVVASEPWHNPILPANFGADDPLPTPKAVEERGSQQCSFYMKTGACRYGDRCSRTHPHPSISTTLLIPNMYISLALRERLLNERGQEGAIEHDDREAYEDFRKFFYDVLDEFSKAGQVVQFKVSCNEEVHLRGNVYVQYSSEEECGRAYHMFNGRWYAQKQLSCQFCPVTRWRAAICGLANQNRCPKGRNCNFLHVYRNPGGAFARADRDLPPLTSSPTQKTSRRRSGRGRSPQQRSHSPYRQSHSRSPHGRSHSRSPYHRSHPRSPHHRSHSRSPHRRSHSRSPHHRFHSRSPHCKSHSRSPRHRSRSHSPRRRSRSRHRTSYWHDRSTSRDRYRGRLRHRYHRSRSKGRRERKTSREKWHQDHHRSSRSQRSRSGSASMSPASESDNSSPKHKNKKTKKKKKSKKKDRKHKRRHKHHHSSSHSQNGDKSREGSEVRVMEGETSAVGGEANVSDFTGGVNEEMEADCRQLIGSEDTSYTDTGDGSLSGGHQARECLVTGDSDGKNYQLSTGSEDNERSAPERSQDNSSTSVEVVKKI